MSSNEGGKGFIWYHDYMNKTAKLSDQELGRLVRALTVFSETGEEQELAGRESIAYDFISEDIRRAKAAYQDKCEKNARAGANGASARWKKGEDSGIAKMANDSERCRTLKTDSENGINKEQEQIYNSLPPYCPPLTGEKGEKVPGKSGIQAELDSSGLSDRMKGKVSEWLSYKGKGAYKPAGVKALISRVEKFSREYGEDSVIEVIDDSMANGYKGIVFDRCEKVSKKNALSAKTPPEGEKSFDAEDFFDRALRRSYAVMEKAAKEWSGDG